MIHCTPYHHLMTHFNAYTHRHAYIYVSIYIQTLKYIHILITYAIYITHACPCECNDHDSWRTNCSYSFFRPSMKLVDRWDHSNREEKGRLIFICPSQKAYRARRKNAMKCPDYVRLEKI